MEKKSVNGKSFDEVFAERGKRVNFPDLKAGKCYLFIKLNGRGWNILHRHKETLLNGQREQMWCDCEVFDDGAVFHRGFIEPDAVGPAYAATKDQISLLNSYRNA